MIDCGGMTGVFRFDGQKTVKLDGDYELLLTIPTTEKLQWNSQSPLKGSLKKMIDSSKNLVKELIRKRDMHENVTAKDQMKKLCMFHIGVC